MNAAHFHLMINHFPAILMIAGAATGVWAWGRKSADGKRVALGLIAAAAVFSLISYFSGEPASEFLESTVVINDMHIEEHEEVAGYATLLSILAGLLASANLVAMKKARMNSSQSHKNLIWLGVATSLAAALALAALAQTGLKGGIIRHPELNENPTGLSILAPERAGTQMDESADDQDQETEFQIPSSNETKDDRRE